MKDQAPLYAIMGITGRVGGAVADTLLWSGKKVRGIVRDRAKAASWEAADAELAIADSEDPAALTEAFRGVDGVFAMIPPYFAPAPGFPEARAIIASLRQALEAAQPPAVVLLSSVGAHQSQDLGLITQLHLLEQELAGLEIPQAFIRAAWFLENSTWDVPSAIERGEIDAFLNPLDRLFPMVSTTDIGQLAADTLQEDWDGRRFLELEGPQRYSMQDVAATFSRLLKRPVKASPVARSEWAALFEQQGMPAGRIAPRIEMLDGFNSGWIDFEDSSNIEHHRGPTTMEQVFTELLAKTTVTESV